MLRRSGMFRIESAGRAMEGRDDGAKIAGFPAGHPFFLSDRKFGCVISPAAQDLDFFAQFDIWPGKDIFGTFENRNRVEQRSLEIESRWLLIGHSASLLLLVWPADVPFRRHHVPTPKPVKCAIHRNNRMLNPRALASIGAAGPTLMN